MGITSAAFAFAADCACCPPGTSRKETVTEALPAASRHAFLQVVRQQKLPRDVLLRIFSLAVERRVVTVHQPPEMRRGRQPHEPDLGAFAGMCLEVCDDAPP